MIFCNIKKIVILPIKLEYIMINNNINKLLNIRERK